MNWKKTVSIREQILLGLVLLALVVMFARIFYSPRLTSNREVQKKLVSLEMERASLEKFTQALMQSAQEKAIVRSLSPALQVLRGTLKPVAETMPDLFRLVADREFLRGLQVLSLNYLPPKQETGYRKVGWEIKVEGSFSMALDYLKRFQELPVLFKMEQMSMESPGGESGEVVLTISGTLVELERKL